MTLECCGEGEAGPKKQQPPTVQYSLHLLVRRTEYLALTVRFCCPFEVKQMRILADSILVCGNGCSKRAGIISYEYPFYILADRENKNRANACQAEFSI